MKTHLRTIRSQAAKEVTRFGQELGIDLQLDDQGSCYLEHRNGMRMAIMLTGDSQVVTAVALLSSLELTEAQIGEILTEFNWFGSRIRGATLSWNPQGHSFLLWYSRDANSIKTDDLGLLLARLLDTAQAIKPELESRIAEADIAAAGASEAEQAPFNWIEQRA